MQSIAVITIVFAIYWGAVELLKRRGLFERYNISIIGPVLMIRTKKGLNLLEKLSKWRKFWRIFADFGLPAVFLGMGFMFSLILLTDYILFTRPPEPSALTNPKNVLLLPGINDYIPFLWGLIGLVVTLVVHEFSHAILCRVEGVKVKSLGILLALIPIGGFAEPDEAELTDKNKVTRRQRVRIYSAGVVSNFAVAAVSFAMFIYLLNFLTPTVIVIDSDIKGVEPGSVVVEINGIKVKTQEDVYKAINNTERVSFLIKKGQETKSIAVPNIRGVKIAKLYRLDGQTFPAEEAGMKEGMIIVKINNTPIKTPQDFQKIMSQTKPGQMLKIAVFHNGTYKSFNVTLANLNGRGFLGVYVQTTDYIGGLSLGYSSVILDELKSIPEKLKSARGWIYLVAMPFLRFQGFTGMLTEFFEAPAEVFWLLNLFYWIGWLNFYVGLFNCLPAIPLDGGRIFHETFSYILARKYGDKADEVSSKIVKTFAIIVFTSILLSIVIPNIPR